MTNDTMMNRFRQRWLAVGASLAVIVPGGSIEALYQGATNLVARQGFPWFVSERETDPQVEAVLDRYLDRLEAAGIDPKDQGVWFQLGTRLLVQHQGTTARSAASLTKLGTTLAALDRWGMGHAFVTEIYVEGDLVGDTLQGDLVVRGGGNPFFVWEEAIAIGNALQAAGIRQIAGDLIVEGNFLMNFLPDPMNPVPDPHQVSGQLFRNAIDRQRWSPAAMAQYQTMPAGTPQPAVVIEGDVRTRSRQASQLPAQGTLLLRHRSLPLGEILRQMNIYSNNAIAQNLANPLGDGPKIAQTIAELTGLSGQEIRVADGSGLNPQNQYSPRAIAVLLNRLQAQLRYFPNPVGDGPEASTSQPQGDLLGEQAVASPTSVPSSPAYTLFDTMPVAGFDIGTLIDRAIPIGSAVKTGSLWNVSALAGTLPTQQGPVTFAIINGAPKLETLRQEQDRLLQEVQAIYGKPAALPQPLQQREPLPSLPPQSTDPDRSPLSARSILNASANLVLGDPSRIDLAPALRDLAGSQSGTPSETQ